MFEVGRDNFCVMSHFICHFIATFGQCSIGQIYILYSANFDVKKDKFKVLKQCTAHCQDTCTQKSST